MATPIETGTLLRLFESVLGFVEDLRGDSTKKKKDSIEVLDNVILASNVTLAYVSEINDGLKLNQKEKRDRERKISYEWKKLSRALQHLGQSKLAKICDIKGTYWATKGKDGTSQFSRDFLDKAGTSLSNVETLAKLALKEIST